VAFENIYGQAQAVRVLQSAIASERIPGAYLFVGPPGVGKRFTAIQFAKALSCDGEGEDACDSCPNCRLINREEFPDLFVPVQRDRRIIKGSTATDRGKGYLIDIVSRLHFPPVMGRFKVVLLDPADRLTDEAGNMLLKILEEPPKKTLFLLITTLEDAVLPTLVSRCQRLRFPPLPVDTVRQFLVDRGENPALAAAVAKASRGSIEHALELGQTRLMEQKLEVVDFLLNLFSNPLHDRVESSVRLLGTAGENERQAVSRVGTIAGLLARDILWAASGFAPEELVFSERGKPIEKLSRRLSTRGALDFAGAVRELTAGIQRNENPRHLLYFLGNTAVSLAGHGEAA